jgi:hypothetical protein
MVRRLTVREGELLVRLARQAVEEYVRRGVRVKPPTDLPPALREVAGVFVTLNRLSGEGRELRGCIGYPLGVKPLVEAMLEVAVEAAVADPRFPPVRAEELDRLLVEVSVLTPPIRVEAESPREYPRHIRVGRDGLLVKWRWGQGLLLPQVPIEHGWDEEEFLCQTCLKAGAPPDCWLLEETEVYRFEAQVFEEVEPRGRVVERPLAPGC